MFKHILVPLDGSKLAESSLTAASYLAQKTQASVTLIHVIEKNAPEAVHGDHHLTDAQEAEHYLKLIAENNFPADINVEYHVHSSEVSNVPRSIVDHEDEFDPDLIVMCTHGKGGLHEFLVGSIAQQVITMGKTPVLLIRPQKNGETTPFKCDHLLTPLDGLPDHELILPFARTLAKVCHADIHLLAVVPTLATLKGQRAAAGKLLPGTMTAMLQFSEENTQNYLSASSEMIKLDGISATTEVVRGDPAEKIIETANKDNSDIILLVTHGRIGQNAFWAGSVAPQVSGRSQIPVLLVPFTEKDQKAYL